MRALVAVLAFASACRSAAPRAGDNPKAPNADTAAGSGAADDQPGSGPADSGPADSGPADSGPADSGSGDDPDGTTWTDPETGLRLLTDTANRSWADSAAWCAARGATLLSLSDAAMNARVWEALYDGEDGVGLTNEHTWIGLHDPGTGWAWSDGAALLFTAWSGAVTTDPYGTATFGQAAAFGDSAAPTWLEAPGNWAFAVVCRLP